MEDKMIFELGELMFVVDNLIDKLNVIGLTEEQFCGTRVMLSRSVQKDGRVVLDCGLLVPQC